MTAEQMPILMAIGTALLALGALLWALRVSDGARGRPNATAKWRATAKPRMPGSNLC